MCRIFSCIMWTYNGYIMETSLHKLQISCNEQWSVSKQEWTAAWTIAQHGACYCQDPSSHPFVCMVYIRTTMYLLDNKNLRLWYRLYFIYSVRISVKSWTVNWGTRQCYSRWEVQEAVPYCIYYTCEQFPGFFYTCIHLNLVVFCEHHHHNNNKNNNNNNCYFI